AMMESGPFPEEVPERRVCVVGSELVENYTVYVMDVTDGHHRWTVKHRYSDFYELHEKLTVEKKVDRQLLPPKKILGKNSRSLVERRQKELELYLQMLLQQFPEAMPTALNVFLHFHLYEINGITAALAEELFHKGEQLLQAGEVFSLHPLQLYSISQQLRLANPTCFNGDAKTDLGHILDFTCRLRYLKIFGTRGPVGTSNIQESSLPFDLSIFKSLLQLEISDCNSRQILGLPTLRSSLATMSIHRSTESMMVVLVPEASEFSQWEPEGVESRCPVTAVIPMWTNLTTLDLSHNCISNIDNSVKLISKVEFLDLSYNHLSLVENLQHLYNLVHVDLSYNSLKALNAAHTCLGNIKTLSLAGNQLERLSGLSKLYSLVNLDLSHNQVAQLEEIKNIGSLPCLEILNLSSNPVCIIPDYRTKVLTQFGDRAAEICLDFKVTTEKELDTVEVLKAIQKAKEAKDRMSSSETKVPLSCNSANNCATMQDFSHIPPSPRPLTAINSQCKVPCGSHMFYISACSPSSKDGYFEMGLDDSVEEPVCSSPSLVNAHVAEEDLLEEVLVRRVMWCCCVWVDEEVKQGEACLVLTDRLLGLLTWSHDPMSTSQERGKNLASDLQNIPEALAAPQLLPPSLISSWEQEENLAAQGGYPSHIICCSSSDTSSLPSDVVSEDPHLLSLLFLTHRHLWVLRMDFRDLAVHQSSSSSSWAKLVRVPLGSVVLHPRDRDAQMGDWTNLRSYIKFVSDVFLLSWDSSGSKLKTEGNQLSHHLVPGLSPGLKLLAGLKQQQLLTYFHRYVAVSHPEELRHVLWLSVVLYKSPETELTCCLLLSNDSIYFLLEDLPTSHCSVNHHKLPLWFFCLIKTQETDSFVQTHLCCCLSFRLSDLLAVNVGLFDQYFRLVGHSADHIVCCLSRDSYATGIFLQELMSALSLHQQQLPPPEPSDQDFYSQFTNTNTSKMQNYELIHSSKVKFIYPSEEEMEDLTFIVADRKNSAPPSSCNILLYLLVFQVGNTSGTAVPRTLILTSTDVLLLDEDYVSYPLPDLAKEPPSRERYQLCEARRIRDLDRVLLGYQTYPQALTLVFDDLPGPDLLCHLTMDHFASSIEETSLRGGVVSQGLEGEVHWCIFVPGADSRERLISLLARQWEGLCSRELPVELTG
uniref:Nischarin n=1 Tax=Nothobranchius furzeri TaxID=105023 RepID=A0A8C6W0N6_NOTFU